MQALLILFLRRKRCTVMVMNFRRAVNACTAPLRKMEPAEDFEIDLITPRGPVVMGYQRASIETADKNGAPSSDSNDP